jgi:hypothetical protein
MQPTANDNKEIEMIMRSGDSTKDTSYQ